MIDHGSYSFTLDDVRGTVGALGEWWRQLTAGRDALPAGDAGRALVADLSGLLGVAVEGEAVEPALDQLSAAALHALRTADEGAASDLLGVALGGIEAITFALRPMIPASGEGEIVQINVSGGGVPKLPVAEMEVDFGGLVADRQHARRHHGRPWQALCLWSTEVVDAFAADGHPIGYGAAGENLTISGLAWEEIRAGVRLHIGDVVAEVSLFALPCTKNSQWFLGGDHTLMHHDRGPVSRVYAWVREPGRVVTGDEVRLIR